MLDTIKKLQEHLEWISKITTHAYGDGRIEQIHKEVTGAIIETEKLAAMVEPTKEVDHTHPVDELSQVLTDLSKSCPNEPVPGVHCDNKNKGICTPQ